MILRNRHAKYLTTANMLLITCLTILTLSCGGSSSSNRRSMDQGNADSNPRPYFNEFDSSEGVDIVISYGQSNAVGSGIIQATPFHYDTGNTKAQKCEYESINSYINGVCAIYNPISNPSDISLKGGYSSWTSFDQRLSTLSNRKMLLINGAAGGKYLTDLLPMPEEDTDNPPPYLALILHTKHAIAHYGEEHINSISIIWLQGEAEASLMAASAWDINTKNAYLKKYFENLTYLHQSIILDLDIPKLNMFIDRVGVVDQEIFSAQFSSNLNDLGYWQIEFCVLVSFCNPLSILPRTFSHSNGLLATDGIHYSNLGYDMLGEENANNFYIQLDSPNSLSFVLAAENQEYPPTTIIEPPF